MFFIPIFVLNDGSSTENRINGDYDRSSYSWKRFKFSEKSNFYFP